MNENEYISDVLIPSLLKAAECIEGAKGFEESVDAAGLPAVLVHMEEDNYVISCIPASDEEEVYLYRVSETLFQSWEFIETVLPADLEVFPYLIRIYNVLRGINVEKISFEGEQSGLDAAAGLVASSMEQTRLTSLSGILSELGLENVYSRTPEGRRCLVAMEEGEEVLFSYMAVLPDEDISLLCIEWDGKEALLPETGAPRDEETYRKVLENLEAFE
jgi:hypothetical protein